MKDSTVVRPLSWDGLTKERSVLRPSPGGIACVCPAGVPEVEVLKLSCMPEIKKLRERQGEHRALTETGETRVVGGSSVRAC